MKKFRNPLKKIVVLAFLVVFCMTFMALPVYAASDYYKSTLAFQGEYGGKSRKYYHNNIMYSATASSYYGGKEISPNSSKFIKEYRVELYRKNGWFSSSKVGSAKLSRYKYGSAKWTNVGKGEYFFYFVKARDGVTVKSKNVVMKGY